LEEEIPARRPDKTWLTLLSVGGGYDDNPLAFPELRQTGLTEEDEDFFVESLAYGQGYVRGNSGNGLRLHGFVYTKQYADLNIVDTSAFHGGLTYETSPGEWQVEYGAGGGHSRVDGSRLTNQVQGRLRVKRRGGRNEYSIQYRPVYHDADNAFFFLEGWQHKVDVRWRRHWDNARLTLRYRLEANDRDDRGTEDTFVSFSPLDNSILLETDWYPTPIWTFTAGAEYTNSDYDGKNRLTDVDGIFKVMERESEEIRAWAGIEYDLTPRWRLRAEYSYLNNDDNFRLYDYSRNEAKLTVEFTY